MKVGGRGTRCFRCFIDMAVIVNEGFDCKGGDTLLYSLVPCLTVPGHSRVVCTAFSEYELNAQATIRLMGSSSSIHPATKRGPSIQTFKLQYSRCYIPTPCPAFIKPQNHIFSLVRGIPTPRSDNQPRPPSDEIRPRESRRTPNTARNLTPGLKALAWVVVPGSECNVTKDKTTRGHPGSARRFG